MDGANSITLISSSFDRALESLRFVFTSLASVGSSARVQKLRAGNIGHERDVTPMH